MRRSYALIASVVTLVGVVSSLAAFFYYHPDFIPYLVNGATEAVHCLLFAALAWAAYFLGRLVTRSVFRQAETYWEVDLAVGFFCFGTAAFLLAVFHLLYPWVVRGFVLAVLFLSAPTLARFVRRAPSFFAERPAVGDRGVPLLLLLAAPFFLAVAVRAAAPPEQWDVLVYHLYLPKAYAAHHGFFYLPRMAYSSMPLGAEMMFTWGFLWDGLGVAAAVAPLFNVLMVAASWRLARRYLDEFWATAAALLVLFTPSFAAFFAAAYVDFILGAFALMALVVYLKGIKGYGDAALAGVLLGAAMGVKYTGVYPLLAFVPVFIFDFARRRLGFRHALVVVAVAAAAFAPWPAKAWVERGNPVFPSLYGIFGGRDLSPAVAVALERWQRGIGMGRGVVDYLLLPYRVSLEAGAGYARFDGALWPFAVLTFAFALIWFRRPRLLLWTAAYFAAWATLASQQLRFLSAAVGALAVVSAGAFAAATAPLKNGARNAVTWTLVLIIGAAGYVLNMPFFKDSVSAVAYMVTRDAGNYLRQRVGVYAVDEYVNRNLPPEATVLMIFENHLLYLERRAIYDSFYEASETLLEVQKLNTPAEVAAYVAGLGATHILTSRWEDRYFWHFYGAATRALWERYLEEYTEVIYDDGTYELRVIVRGSTPPA